MNIPKHTLLFGPVHVQIKFWCLETGLSRYIIFFFKVDPDSFGLKLLIPDVWSVWNVLSHMLHRQTSLM